MMVLIGTGLAVKIGNKIVDRYYQKYPERKEDDDGQL